MKINNVDKIFVIHHKPLIDRKQRLKNIFEKIDLDVEWVEKYLPEEIDYEKEVGQVIIEKGPEWAIQQNKYTYYENVGKKITMSELSLYLKHKECLLEQVKNNYQNIIVFEDDINLDMNLIEYLNNNLEEFQEKIENENANFLMLGTAFGFRPVSYNGKFIHYNKNQLTRCAHAYVVNINCAQKIIDRLYPINLPWDFKLNEIIILEDLNVYWSEPGLTQFSLSQGTTVKK